MKYFEEAEKEADKQAKAIMNLTEHERKIYRLACYTGYIAAVRAIVPPHKYFLYLKSKELKT